MPDPASDLPRFPEPGNDPDRPPPRRGWSPVALGLAAVAAVTGLVAALVAFGDPEVRLVFFAVWFLGAILLVRSVPHWRPGEGEDEE